MADDLVRRLRCAADMNVAVFHPWIYGEAADEIERLRKALATYACRCGDCECYVDEFVPSCGRSAREALGLILNANSLPYAQEIAAKALEEKK